MPEAQLTKLNYETSKKKYCLCRVPKVMTLLWILQVCYKVKFLYY